MVVAAFAGLDALRSSGGKPPTASAEGTKRSRCKRRLARGSSPPPSCSRKARKADTGARDDGRASLVFRHVHSGAGGGVDSHFRSRWR